ncbi:hypothetical protein CTAM01_02329 [Colletotrichum tamarilloi]|uniref:Secreted protein n=1 Tax=Colletotrichum tamarilloi TaxID=1209934 RepID=A0ABQ9RNI0_9PEZI|nr:uncharacterized protein CTAM01_02329 [Colletotrichum tamarilloi]KAK1508543.1 hypothetical protein CTAM01_02329 [Colletotrichum tamarilloi]
MMNYSSITCFLSIPATLSAHPYPFLQRVLAGGVTFIRQTGPTNDSSNSRHYQGSGIVRYGGAWRGSLFPWFPARKKKVSYGTLSLAPAPHCWPAPRYITLAATPRSQQQHQVRYPRRLTFCLPLHALHALLALTPLTHCHCHLHATSARGAVAPWSTPNSRASFFIHDMPQGSNSSFAHLTIHPAPKLPRPILLRLPSPLVLHDPEVCTVCVWSARSHRTLLLKSLAQLTLPLLLDIEQKKN